MSPIAYCVPRSMLCTARVIDSLHSQTCSVRERCGGTKLINLLEMTHLVSAGEFGPASLATKSMLLTQWYIVLLNSYSTSEKDGE